MCGSAQRPSAVIGCTLEEFTNRKKRGDVEVISVKDHKTSSGGPARLTMDSRAVRVLRGYVDIIRPRIGNDNKLAVSPSTCMVSTKTSGTFYKELYYAHTQGVQHLSLSHHPSLASLYKKLSRQSMWTRLLPEDMPSSN